jgi:hypothetical protein
MILVSRGTRWRAGKGQGRGLTSPLGSQWDSRTIHWNCAPTGDLTRVVVYVCYYPAAMFTEEQLVRKKELFDQLRQTTHWPQKGVSHGGTPQRNGKDDPHHRAQPVKPPVFTERMKKLAGGLPY